MTIADRLSMKLLCVTSVGALVLSSSELARAAPSSAELDEMFAHFGVEARGFGALSPSLDKALSGGGDAHFLIGGAPGALLLGGRLGSAGGATQFGGFDGALRIYPRPSAVTSFFVQGGVFYGSQTTDSFAFSVGTIAALAVEGGVELPRTSALRLTASLRADLGHVWANPISRIQPAPTFAMFSLDIGLLLGGEGTKSEHVASPDSGAPALEQTPIDSPDPSSTPTPAAAPTPAATPTPPEARPSGAPTPALRP